MGPSKHIWGVKIPPQIWGCQVNAPKCKSYMPLKKIGVFEHMGVLRWTGQHWGHTRGCLNVWGCWGHQGSVQVHGASKHMGVVQMAPNIWGVKSMPTKCKSYMPLKKIRGVWTYGVLGASGGIQMQGHPNISYHISYHFVSLWVSFSRGVWHRNMDVPMVKSNFKIYQ